jgi:hypothetical protein
LALKLGNQRLLWGFGFTRFSPCPAVGTGGINTVKIAEIKPTSITVLRLKWSDAA